MERIKSILYSFVVGDALGVPVEFRSRDYLKSNPVTEMIGFGSHNVPEGVWSDDTSMTLATIHSIIEKRTINYNDMANKFCSWYSDAKYTATNYVFDIGITTRVALVDYQANKGDATKCGASGINNNGNGSLMRILPIAFYCYYNLIEDNKNILEFVKNTSSITHAHEISTMGCYIYVQYVINLLKGKNKNDSYTIIQNLDYSMFKEETQKEYKRILNYDIFNLKRDDIKSSGYVVSTLEASIWCLLTNDNLKDTVLTAVNLGNDTDTVGAITGSLAGIIYNYNDIPYSWIEKLENKKLLDDLIEKFYYCLSGMEGKKN